MGEVWKARDTRLGRDVAIKISAEQFSERFEREARAVAALNHPNICTLHDVGPNYLVMEYIEGTPLKGPLSVEKAVECSCQILDALDAAHRKGITHRDLKPANILVTKQGIKLLDFGLAKQAVRLGEDEPTKALTDQGQIIGTLQYMSPEQLQGKEADPRSDLFSFGCVLYEMLSGKRAFDGQSSASVIAAILEREPTKLETIPALDRVVRRSLAKDPDHRFQTARDLKASLNWALEQAPAVTASRPSRRWWIAAAGAILLSALGGGWAVAHFRQPPSDDRVLKLQLEPPDGVRFVFEVLIGGIALSPDGKTAAYVASANGKTALWVQPLDGGTARPLPGTEGAASPFWSPDGRAIAFFSGALLRLERVDLAGGTPLLICDTHGPYGGVWGGDGQIIFGTIASGLFRVPATGGTPVPVTTLDASRNETAHRWPQLLPGGRILYWVQADKPENTGVYASFLAKPNERTHLLTTDTNALYAHGNDGKSYLLWLRRGTATLMAQELDLGSFKLSGEPRPIAGPVASVGAISQMDASMSVNGVLLYSVSNSLSQFTWLDSRGMPQGVVGEPGEWSNFDVSRDGRRIAAARDRADGSDLWMLDTDRGVSSRFTFRPGLSLYPVWSPDGRTIVFSADAPRNLFRKEISGAGMEQRIAQSPTTQLVTDWSRDGRSVLYFDIAPSTQFDLWVLPVTPDGRPAPDAKARPYLRTPFNEWQGHFSPEPNPRWVAYQSDESGRYEVYINSFPQAGSKIRISTDGGAFPQWGALVGKDARELFYVSPDSKLMMVTLKFVGDSVEPSGPHELFILPTETGSGAFSPYEVAPDGNRFLVRATPQQASPPLTVIVNWPALLKKGQAAP